MFPVVVGKIWVGKIWGGQDCVAPGLGTVLDLGSARRETMQPIVAVIAAGMMGSGVGGRLAQNGIEVRTALGGRSEASVKRAKEAGMVGVSDAEIAASDFILSIVPPGDAQGLADRLAP